MSAEGGDRIGRWFVHARACWRVLVRTRSYVPVYARAYSCALVCVCACSCVLVYARRARSCAYVLVCRFACPYVCSGVRARPHVCLANNRNNDDNGASPIN